MLACIVKLMARLMLMVKLMARLRPMVKLMARLMLMVKLIAKHDRTYIAVVTGLWLRASGKSDKVTINGFTNQKNENRSYSHQHNRRINMSIISDEVLAEAAQNAVHRTITKATPMRPLDIARIVHVDSRHCTVWALRDIIHDQIAVEQRRRHHWSFSPDRILSLHQAYRSTHDEGFSESWDKWRGELATELVEAHAKIDQ